MRTALSRHLCLACFFLTFLIPTLAGAQAEQPLEQEGQLRVSATLEKKLVKKLRLTLSPEMRTNNLNPDKYMVEAGLKYSPIDYLSLRTAYRADLNERKRGLDDGYRYRFDVVGSWPITKRFEPNARVRYTHRFGPTRAPINALRYLISLDYRIKKTQLTLSPMVETYHLIEDGMFERMRYGFGAGYRFYKTKKVDQFVSAGYRFDYYLHELHNVHIIDVGYKIVF